MKVVFALAFLAVAKAAVIDVAQPIVPDDVAMYMNDPIFPMMARTMLQKYGFVKPVYDEYAAYAKAMGLDNVASMNYLRALYDEPALVFFRDPAENVVSYYADEGLYKSALIPEVRSAFDNLIGVSDVMAIAYQPEHMLGEYRTILPNQFFEPVNDVSLARFFQPDAYPHEHAIVLNKHDMGDIFPTAKYIAGPVGINELPFSYKYPVALNFAVANAAPIDGPLALTKSVSPVVPYGRFYNYNYFPRYPAYHPFYQSHFNRYPYFQAPYSQHYYNYNRHPYGAFPYFQHQSFYNYPYNHHYNFGSYFPYNFQHNFPYNFQHNFPYNFQHNFPYNFQHNYMNNFPYYYNRHHFYNPSFNYYNRPYSQFYNPYFYGKSALKAAIPAVDVMNDDVPFVKAAPHYHMEADDVIANAVNQVQAPVYPVATPY